MEYRQYDVALRYTGRYGATDAKLRWFFANDITSRSKRESVELATETLREAMPFAKVNAFFVELSENQRSPQYPARIGLVFD